MTFLNRVSNDLPKTVFIVIMSIVSTAFTFLLMVVLLSTLASGSSKNNSWMQTVQVADTKDRFSYLLKTNAGDVGLNKANISVDDPVTIPELSGKYSYIRREKEEYTAHVNVTTDSKGNTSTYTTYSWDNVETKELQSNKYRINGILSPKVNLKEHDLHLNDNNTNKTSYKGFFFTHNSRVKNDYYYINGDTRYYYIIKPKSLNTNVIVNLSNDKINMASKLSYIVENSQTIQQQKESSRESALFFNRIVYPLSTILSLVAFVLVGWSLLKYYDFIY